MVDSEETQKARQIRSPLKGLRGKRARCSKATLKDMITKYEKSHHKNFGELRGFFENERERNRIRKSLRGERTNSFDTAWEGALSILNTIDRETNSRIKRADMTLLDEDLTELKTHLDENAL